MQDIDGKIVSDDIFKKKFVCDLSACKGACCVEGDAGAPLTMEEATILEDIYEDVKPYMRPEGIAAVKEEGVFTIDWDNEAVTPLVNGKECAFVSFDEQNIAKCSIEQAYNEGKTYFKKPISCALYPIRVSKLSNESEALNYHEWKVCEPACDCGQKLDVPVYKFLKEPIIRKWGENFFKKLEKTALVLGK